MTNILHKINQLPQKQSIAYLINSPKELKELKLEKSELDYINKRYPEKEIKIFTFYKSNSWIIICVIPKKVSKEAHQVKELYRKLGNKLCTFLNKEEETVINISAKKANKEFLLSFTEGLLLSIYSFEKYKESGKKKNKLSKVNILSDVIEAKELKELTNIVTSVHLCRDLVNEPASGLNALEFAKIINEESIKAKIKVEVFKKARISSLKMNALLAVNQGSKIEPTFTVLEWKPSGAKNKKPYILVGKGVMYDTGGLSLKPSDAMEAMKSDMAGAAAVFACIRAIALNKLNIHVIGLLPATDNRLAKEAIAPGDIITMMNNKTVEVINTDAEGRLILADALCYASKFKPELVIDIATLTGSASRAIGKYGIIGMHEKCHKQMELLKNSGNNVYERIVELPMWDEYDEEIKSDIADIRNVGISPNAGAITAGVFLKQFTSYPWIHLDIASMGFMESKENYIGKGGSGVGVRLFYDFLKHKAKTTK